MARGDCGVGVVNSYYVARLLSGESGAEDKALMQGVKVVVPDPAHINVSGAGVTRHSRHPEAARRLLEFLASPEGGEPATPRPTTNIPWWAAATIRW